ncbi:Hypothetical protein PHPALM_21042 [Phytophthora palmivora]|uniref:Uncharacterized protein n=1 Tax=Phytophthora palmivora TaxID=4796 RepID=A0A2P4XDB5_9STRA|nr:Hypothetical protein PHPALM_21042 [Phytophthora palmivora]
MDEKFAFLQPWQNAIRECKILHDSIHVVDTREFRASHLLVQCTHQFIAGRHYRKDMNNWLEDARFRYLFQLMWRFDVTAKDCNESVKLWSCSILAFLQLLGEFVVVADHFNDLLTPDLIFVHPVWECYLVGTLNSEEVVATWGKLFGCEKDPMQYSEEFRVAMRNLEVMARDAMSLFDDFMGRQTTAEWCNKNIVIEWTAEHVAIPTKGIQVVTTRKEVISIVNSLSPRFDAVFDTNVPEVVQLCAVSDPANMLKTWEQLPPSSAPQTVESLETMKPRFSARGMSELTLALSRMNLTSIRLNLDEVVDSMASGKACVNAGVLLTSLVCGRSFAGHWEECCVPLLHSRGNMKHLDVAFARNSAAGPAGICSAMLKSSLIESLTVNMGTLGDEFWWLNQARWGWLAYALWSSESISSVQSAKVTNIRLSRSAVASVALALTNCYPPSTQDQNMLETSSYGFIDVQRGAKLRPGGLDDNDSDNLMMISSCRCRARYNPGEMGDQAEIIVPGNGVCTLQLGDGANTFVPDYVEQRFMLDRSHVQTLRFKFFLVENPALVTDLLALIGSNLCSLKMGIYWTGRHCSILLDHVATACPRLEDLYLTDFDVTLSSSKELRNWGLKKMVIQSCEEVVGLTDYLSDPLNRMSLELKELEIKIPRSNQISSVYIDALAAHNGEYIAVMKEELPLECKSAMVSVVESGNCEGYHSNDAKSVQCLNDTLMRLIFAFAATPMCRTVRVLSL